MKPILKWLYPGLGIKRWFFMFFGGVLLGCFGLAQLIPKLVPYSSSVFWGIINILLGLVVAVFGLRQTFRSLLSVFLPREEERIIDLLFKQRQLEKGSKVVAIGGGTGLSVLLRGVKKYTGNITAIVTVTDNGGHSGRLREELGMLPPGDIRNCLVALADTEPLMEKIFQYRFAAGESLMGQNLGNLFLAGLTEILGDFTAAIKQVSRVLAVRGQVLPSTLESVTLCAELASGEVVEGEIEISSSREPIQRLFLNPENPRPLKEAIEAIEGADVIILGPGSLYTSVLPNLLVNDLAAAIRRARGLCIYICNVMTQPGETDDYTAADHLIALQDHLGAEMVDYVVVNTERVPAHLLKRYEEEGSYSVKVDLDRLRTLGVEVIQAKLISHENYVRHDSGSLARVVMGLTLD